MSFAWCDRDCNMRSALTPLFFYHLWYSCASFVVATFKPPNKVTDGLRHCDKSNEFSKSKMPRMVREVFQSSKWKFKIFPSMNMISRHFFTPLFFLLQLNPTYMKRISHLVSVKKITFKSSYNWFKIDIHQQLRPLIANYLAMFKVISTTIYT